MDTSLIWTLRSVPSVSVLEKFNCMKWKRKMPKDYFPLGNLNLVSRMELLDQTKLVTMATCMLC